jgi:hypothetical protein
MTLIRHALLRHTFSSIRYTSRWDRQQIAGDQITVAGDVLS